MISSDRNKILIDSIRRLLRRRAIANLRKIVNKTHGADLSVVFRSVSRNDQKKLFDLIDDVELKGMLLSELDDDSMLFLIESIGMEEIVDILYQMPNDDVADLLGKLPDEKADAILQRMKKEESEEVEDLLRYGDETAGGIMVPEFIALKEDMTAGQAIASLQKEHIDVEMPFYLYVIDEYERLTGVCSLRQLVMIPPQTPLKNFMTTDVYSVQTDMDQEEVAKLVAHYDILAVPVVDESNKLVGIITVDDVIDIIREEATEDIMKMAGIGDEFIETKSIFRSTKIRLPWLFASCLGGILAFFVIGSFGHSIKQFAALAAFIPVVMGMGGNIGTQSSTIVVSGLATGRLHISDLWPVVFREISIGFLSGVVYGMLIGGVAYANFFNIFLTGSVGLAVVSSMSSAALVGSFVPMCFAKLNIDPAVATGPFVTTCIDIVSVYLYFEIATVLINLS